MVAGPYSFDFKDKPERLGTRKRSSYFAEVWPKKLDKMFHYPKRL